MTTTTNITPAKVDHDALPHSGGSWLRQPDGILIRTDLAVEPDTTAPTEAPIFEYQE